MRDERPIWNVRDSPWRAGLTADGGMTTVGRPEPEATGSRHADQTESTRVPPETRKAARATLAEHGWSAHAFLAACLVTVTKNPAKMLALVAPNRLRPKPRGRPSKPKPTEEQP